MEVPATIQQLVPTAVQQSSLPMSYISELFDPKNSLGKNVVLQWSGVNHSGLGTFDRVAHLTASWSQGDNHVVRFLVFPVHGRNKTPRSIQRKLERAGVICWASVSEPQSAVPFPQDHTTGMISDIPKVGLHQESPSTACHSATLHHTS